MISHDLLPLFNIVGKFNLLVHVCSLYGNDSLIVKLFFSSLFLNLI